MKCQWKDGLCHEEDLEKTFTDFGLCYTFNTGSVHGIYHADKQGAEYGLRFVLNIEQYQYTDGPNTDAGQIVIVRNILCMSDANVSKFTIDIYY